MNTRRLFGIIVVFATASVGWFVLGQTITKRTNMLDKSLSEEMDSHWGPQTIVQVAPQWEGNVNVAPSSSKIEVDISHEQRNMGLLWFNTYKVTFCGRYTIPADESTTAQQEEGRFLLRLPGEASNYYNLSISVDDGESLNPGPEDVKLKRLSAAIQRDKDHVVTVMYETNGRDIWLYSPGEISSCDQDTDSVFQTRDGLIELNNFEMTITTDFKDIDYPKGTASPEKRAVDEKANGGKIAKWNFSSLITSKAMGVVVPQPINAGPIAARMSMFAPVSLAFFFTVLFVVAVLKKVSLHPMHYLFIAAGFFAFHILLAYLVDILPVHAAFWICAAVSVILVTTYMRLVCGLKFTVFYVAGAQLVFLVGFSYAFFWVGKTGLTVTISAVVTLFVLMQATARINWSEVLGRKTPPA
ncbi:MAG TPA: hypothetical protein ENL03_02075, partial [Phycisphaerae bacterium]|nr:hypothetical protein [Phycisphaerae bacterium]